MKKVLSFLWMLLSIGIFLGYKSYTENPAFDYATAQIFGYLFYWSVTLFVVSLFAIALEKKKYKAWFSISLVYILIALFSAFSTGDGSSGIVSLDGKELTWFLAGLYFLASLIFFTIQFFKSRKSSGPV